MKRQQRRINSMTRQLLRNEIWIYGREITSFYKMRKVIKMEEL